MEQPSKTPPQEKEPKGGPQEENRAKQRPESIKEYTVSEANLAIQAAIKENLGMVRIRGEISDIKTSHAGNVFFVLKDRDSFINALCSRSLFPHLRNKIVQSLDVIATGEITTSRSGYLLKISSISRKGHGTLLQEIEDRKQRLRNMGLFDSGRKKPIPPSTLINKVGIITSAAGAVLHDIKHRILQRFPKNIMLYDVPVQSPDTERAIIMGVEFFCSLEGAKRPDIIIIARGGGSLEDLIPFNGELLALAASASTIPIISAVGHETDHTVLDLVADLRAPTPTAAAEIITTPTKDDLKDHLLHSSRVMIGLFRQSTQSKKATLELFGRLIKSQDPARQEESKLSQLRNRLDSLFSNTKERTTGLLNKQHSKLHFAFLLHTSKLDKTCSKQGNTLEGAVKRLQNQNELILAKTKASWATPWFDINWGETSPPANALRASLSSISGALGRTISESKKTLNGVESSLHKGTQKLAKLLQTKLQTASSGGNQPKAQQTTWPAIEQQIKKIETNLKALTHRLNQASLQNALNRGFLALQDENKRVFSAQNIQHGTTYGLTMKDGKVNIIKKP